MALPQKIGRFPIVSVLGAGGFGTVLLARDEQLDSDVAIKVLSAKLSADDRYRERFVTEAKMMRDLSFHRTVKVFEVGEIGTQPFFVMEHCAGGTLGDRLDGAGRPLSIGEGAALAAAIGQAMGPWHERPVPIVHRDLKPDNFLIRLTPHEPQQSIGQLIGNYELLVVGDLGLAKPFDNSNSKANTVMYSPGYGAPEQKDRQGTVGPPADVFAASAIVVRAIAGVNPAEVRDRTETAFSDGAFRLTGRLEPELRRGLAFDPDYRPPTIARWASALADSYDGRPEGIGQKTNVMDRANAPGPAFRDQRPTIVDGVDAAAARAAETMVDKAPTPRPPAPSSARGRRWLGILAALLVLAGVAGAATVVLRDRLGGSSGPNMVGPDSGLVGDQVAFAIPGQSDITWEVNGKTEPADVLVFTPDTAGAVRIVAETSSGRAVANYSVLSRSEDVQIIGSAHLLVGQPTTLTAQGADGLELTWIVSGQSKTQPTLTFTPAVPGTVRVILTTGAGATVQRIFTATG